MRIWAQRICLIMEGRKTQPHPMLMPEVLQHRLLPPWPVWSDSELNQEQWDPLPIWPPLSSEEILQKPGFIHPLGSYWLPPSLSDLVVDYVRPVVKGSQVLPPQEWILPQLDDRGQELVNCSPALKAIFSAITGVARLQAEPPYPLIEGISNVFIPTAGPPWRPWHHVYSLNKAGKGAPHKPVVNPSGKYIVRLWYLGTWRSIAVDDRLPVDENGEALLLRDVTGALWAPLLTKALLAVGALTWSAEDELRGWDPVCCLTGWLSLPLPVDCRQLQLPTVWRLCVAALAPEGTDLLVDDLRAFQEAGAEDPFGGQPAAKVSPLDAVSENMGKTALVVQAEDSPGAVVVHGASVLWNAIRYRDRPPTPPWKRHRWKAWALRHGLIQERAPALYRTLRVFCPLGRLQAPPLPDMSQGAAEPDGAPAGDAPKAATRASARTTASSPKKQRQMVQDERDSVLDVEWLAGRLRGLRLLVRPSSFLFAPRLLDVPAAVTDARPSAGAAGAKKASAVGFLAVAPAAFPGCVYALLDSPHAKKMLIALDAVAESVLQAWQERYSAAVGAGDVVTCEGEGEEADAAVVVERYAWAGAAPSRPLLAVPAGACRLLSLPPGQCALRLWCSRLPRHHCLTLLAQDNLFIGSREQVQDRLAAGPGSVLRAQAASVREAALCALRPEPGSADHASALAAFLAACAPPPPADAAPEAAYVRHYVQQALLHMARVARPHEPAAVAGFHLEMQFFFQDQELCMDLLDEEEERELQQLLESEPGIRHVSSGSQLAASIKAGSAGTKDTKGKAKAKGGKKKSQYCDRYKCLAELLSPTDSGVRLLRALVSGRPRLQALLPCGWDLDGLAATWDLRGVTASEGSRGWLALAQFRLNHCRAAPPDTICALNAVVSVARWNLTVVEEATGRPLPPLVGEPQPFSLREGGSYWALLSCWPPADARDVFWRVRALARSKDELPHCCAIALTGRCEPQPDPLPPRQLECGGPYLPGKEQLVGRALLFTHTLPLSLSLRFAVSNPRARFQLRVKRGDNEVVTQRTCTGEVVVPLLVLEERPVRSPSPKQSQQLAEPPEPRGVKSVADRDRDRLTSKGRLQHTMFVVEAHLLRDSWPLTPEERAGAEAAQLAARRRLLVHPQVVMQQESAVLSASPEASLSVVAFKSRSQRRAGRRSPSRAVSASRSAGSRRKLLAARSPTSNASLDEQLPACAPTWALAIVVPPEQESVELKVDDRRERWIRALKEGWEQADPGRAVRAHNLRRQFQPTLPLADLLRASAKQEEKMVEKEKMVEREVVEESKAEGEKVEESEETEVLLTEEAALAEAAARRQAVAEWSSLEAMFCAERQLLLAEQVQRHVRLTARHDALHEQLQAELAEVMAVRDQWVVANTPQPSGKRSKK